MAHHEINTELPSAPHDSLWDSDIAGSRCDVSPNDWKTLELISRKPTSCKMEV